MQIKYNFDYHPSFIKECKTLFKNCSNFTSDFERFKKVINADLDIFKQELPKKYLHVPKKGHNIKLPIFKYRYFYCKNGDGSDLRFIFLLDKSEQLIIFTEVYKKSKKENLDYKRIEKLF
jgi:mRNA-degrading endonuclease RelE of RelBE toxin-antitoxin system